MYCEYKDDYDSAVKFKLSFYFRKKFNMTTKNCLGGSLEPNLKPKLEWHTNVTICMPYIFIIYIFSFYFISTLQQITE